ncbi:MAG TPA: hypothetical protein VII20_21155 [Roseiarcus sp.]|jgi:hypothetical protein
MRYDSTLIGALEPDQLAAAKMRPYPRRNLGRGVLTLLILLRVYVAIAIPVVAYAFVHALLAPQ